MTESMEFMKGFERLETKLDDIRDRVYSIAIETRETMVKQLAYEQDMKNVEKELEELKTFKNKALGALAVVSMPGVISLIYTLTQIFSK